MERSYTADDYRSVAYDRVIAGEAYVPERETEGLPEVRAEPASPCNMDDLLEQLALRKAR